MIRISHHGRLPSARVCFVLLFNYCAVSIEPKNIYFQMAFCFVCRRRCAVYVSLFAARQYMPCMFRTPDTRAMRWHFLSPACFASAAVCWCQSRTANFLNVRTTIYCFCWVFGVVVGAQASSSQTRLSPYEPNAIDSIFGSGTTMPLIRLVGYTLCGRPRESQHKIDIQPNAMAHHTVALISYRLASLFLLVCYVALSAPVNYWPILVYWHARNIRIAWCFSFFVVAVVCVYAIWYEWIMRRSR